MADSSGWHYLKEYINNNLKPIREELNNNFELSKEDFNILQAKGQAYRDVLNFVNRRVEVFK